jgi:hypothetical protein
MKNPQIFEYIEVESSNIKAYGYNPSFDILSVVFNTGEEYWYFEFPALAWADFFEAESKGKFLNEQIKNRYRFQKVTAFEQDVLIDAIETIRRKNVNEGHINEQFSVTCEKFGLNLEDAWFKVLGRLEWYQYQPEEYKQKVRIRVSEIELQKQLGY